MRDVVDRSGRQIVEHVHFVSRIEKCFSEMRSDEPCAAGNENSHSEISRPDLVRRVTIGSVAPPRSRTRPHRRLTKGISEARRLQCRSDRQSDNPPAVYLLKRVVAESAP